MSEEAREELIRRGLLPKDGEPPETPPPDEEEGDDDHDEDEDEDLNVYVSMPWRCRWLWHHWSRWERTKVNIWNGKNADGFETRQRRHCKGCGFEQITTVFFGRV